MAVDLVEERDCIIVLLPAPSTVGSSGEVARCVSCFTLVSLGNEGSGTKFLRWVLASQDREAVEEEWLRCTLDSLVDGVIIKEFLREAVGLSNVGVFGVTLLRWVLDLRDGKVVVEG